MARNASDAAALPLASPHADRCSMLVLVRPRSRSAPPGSCAAPLPSCSVLRSERRGSAGRAQCGRRPAPRSDDLDLDRRLESTRRPRARSSAAWVSSAARTRRSSRARTTSSASSRRCAPEGPRRLRRAPAREPAARPAAADGLRAPVRVRRRRARGRGDQGRPDRPDRLQVPARQLRADALGGERHRAPAVREALRARREVARRRDRVEVHPARRGHVRLRVHVPARRRRSTTSSPAGRPARCSRTRTTSACCPSLRRR